MRIGEAARMIGVSPFTLRRWEKVGKIQSVERSPGGQRLYDLAELADIARSRPPTGLDRSTLCYARVSTTGQRADLRRQEAMLETYCSANGWSFETISDIGSGLNYHKKGLRTLVRKICNGEISRLVLTDRDRLLRFGSELVFSLCEQFNVEVVILNVSSQPSYEEDLASDVLEILTVFSARMYGARSRRNKKLMESIQQAVETTAAETTLADDTAGVTA